LPSRSLSPMGLRPGGDRGSPSRARAPGIRPINTINDQPFEGGPPPFTKANPRPRRSRCKSVRLLSSSGWTGVAGIFPDGSGHGIHLIARSDRPRRVGRGEAGGPHSDGLSTATQRHLTHSLERIERGYVGVPFAAHGGEEFFARDDVDVSLARHLLESARDVDRVADDSVIQPPRVPNGADHRFAGMEPDSDSHGGGPLRGPLL